MKMTNRTIAISLIIALVLSAGAWFYYQGPCGVSKVEAGVDALMNNLNKWENTVSLAGSTSRIALSGPVSSLQSIQQETKDLGVPSCLETAKDHLVRGQGSAISGFLAFMSEQSDSVVSGFFTTYRNRIDLVLIEANKAMECAPFCD